MHVYITIKKNDALMFEFHEQENYYYYYLIYILKN